MVLELEAETESLVRSENAKHEEGTDLRKKRHGKQQLGPIGGSEKPLSERSDNGRSNRRRLKEFALSEREGSKGRTSIRLLTARIIATPSTPPLHAPGNILRAARIEHYHGTVPSESQEGTKGGSVKKQQRRRPHPQPAPVEFHPRIILPLLQPSSMRSR